MTGRPGAPITGGRPVAAPPLRRVLALTALELRLLLRSGESLLVTFGVPLGALVFFGTTDVVPIGDGDPLTFLVPGVLAIAILSTGFVAQAIQTGFERKYGVLKRLGATPLTRAQFVLGKGLSAAVLVVAQVAVLVGVGLALGWRPTASVARGAVALPSCAGYDAMAGSCAWQWRPQLGWLVVAVLLGTLVFVALGLAMAGALRAELVLAGSNAVYLVLVAASDLVFDLPPAADPVIALMPSGALGALLRHGLGGTPASGASAAAVVLAGWGLLAVVVARRTFRWEP